MLLFVRLKGRHNLGNVIHSDIKNNVPYVVMQTIDVEIIKTKIPYKAIFLSPVANHSFW